MYYVSITTTPGSFHIVFNGNNNGLEYAAGNDHGLYPSVFNSNTYIELCAVCNAVNAVRRALAVD